MSILRRIDVTKTYFFCSAALVIFAYGVAVGVYHIFPFHQIKFIKQSVFQVSDEAEMLMKTKPTKHLMPSRYPGKGVITHDKARMAPGLTMVASFFEDGLQLRLLDSHGETVHKWNARVFDIWENFDHIEPPKDRPATDWNVYLNGSLLLPDGSAVFDLKGLVKLDRCGHVVWKVPRMTHHSLEPARGGGFWVGARRYIGAKSKHPPIAPPYFEDTILKVSANGMEILELSILDLLINNGLRGVLYSNNRYFSAFSDMDIIHLNDVEELTENLAEGFPNFKAGDLLVSLRQPNMVFVVDPMTEVIKWHHVGPWIQPHDADFQANGKITVFDNHYDGTSDGSILGGSRIIELDLRTGAAKSLYGGVDDQPMYTTVQGDHQLLENGNILITESDAGRVLEIDREGRLVWEFINRYSEEEVFRIGDAIRYPSNYFTHNGWSCDAKDVRP